MKWQHLRRSKNVVDLRGVPQPFTVSDWLQSLKSDMVLVDLGFSRPVTAADLVTATLRLGWATQRLDMGGDGTVVLSVIPADGEVITLIVPGNETDLVRVSSTCTATFDWGSQEGHLMDAIRALEASVGPTFYRSGMPWIPYWE